MLVAYHGSQALKDRTLATMRAHREADRILQGVYWSNGRGCAVGCLTHDANGGHALYPNRWGIPIELAYMQDAIFEGLPRQQAVHWPERFLRAIRPGSDLSLLWNRWVVETFREDLLTLPHVKRSPAGRAIERVAALHHRVVMVDHPSADEWDAARAVVSAAACDGVRDAVSAAVAAVRAAVRTAMRDAAAAVRAASAASATASAATKDAAWDRVADRLIRLIEQAPMAKSADDGEADAVEHPEAVEVGA